ncbi:MAG: hypothetical protein KAT70_08630, partial [Thermoplasmata archaeon]|nr:hypothetical protein [Thermoplasmata archaeon]
METILVQPVTVTYDEVMDVLFDPTIAFTSVNFVTVGDGAWDVTGMIYYENFTHDGTEETLADAATIVAASGALDVAGNAETIGVPAAFAIDTDKPEATGLTVTPVIIHEYALLLTVDVTYDEPMAAIAPSINLTGGNFGPQVTVGWDITQTIYTCTFLHFGTQEYIPVVNASLNASSVATDVAGNLELVTDVNDSFEVDTRHYRGDLIMDDGYGYWDGASDNLYETIPVVQISEKPIRIDATQGWELWVQNDGDIDDTFNLTWDNTTLPLGWSMEMWESTWNVTNGWWDLTTDITAIGYCAFALEHYVDENSVTTKHFTLLLTTNNTPGYGDSASVDIIVEDGGYGTPDIGTVEAFIPTPDRIVIADAYDSVYSSVVYENMPDLLYPSAVPSGINGTFWAVLYSSIYDFGLGPVDSWWNMTNADGASASTAPDGATLSDNSTFDTGASEGNATMSASYWTGTGWWNDTWTVHVSPVWDELNLTYTPGGEEIFWNATVSLDLPVGHELTLYFSMYDAAGNYIGLPPGFGYTIEGGDTFVTDGGLGFVTVNVGPTNGTVWFNASVSMEEGVWFNDTVEINVLPPTVDMIEIVTDGVGNLAINDQTVDVGFTINGFVAGYNSSLIA